MTSSDGRSRYRRPNLFLCHASSDKAGVRTLCDLLESDGVKPWLDEREILPGQDWEMEIQRALRGSDIVVVCLSRRSVTKEGYLQKEIALAIEVSQEKPEGTIFLVPVRLEECVVPERLRRWHWVDFYSDGGYEKLIAACAHRAQQLGLKLQSKKRPHSKQNSGTLHVQIPGSPISPEQSQIYRAVSGDIVRVNRGPLAGLAGVVIKHKSAFRAVLGVSLLERVVTVEIDVDWVVPIIER